MFYLKLALTNIKKNGKSISHILLQASLQS